MDSETNDLPSRWRIAVLGLLILAGFSLLALRLYRVQVRDSRDYAASARRQSVRRVLLRHGGQIWAEAEPGKGAAFHFVLPSAQDALPQGIAA